MRTTALTVSLATVALLGTLTPTAQAADHHTPRPTCRGEGTDPKAKIRYRTGVLIKAPISTVFAVQTDVAHWPSWQPKAVLSARRLDHGPLRPGSSFRWTTPGPATPTTPATTMTITSTVRQLKHDSCVLWSGPAVGTGVRIDQGIHLWTFTQVKGGVRVHTEETWTGRQAESDVPTATRILGTGLEDWVRDLKTAAEARART
ncbi:SRPBCC family protein [Actinomadura harenae]|uniref:Polyketide cyclase /reductase n=1 Tax=Actinomadura harenae TaxID=2483351 RepID=A0A3M2M312_9ACTN|nr:SRPBCC family protein [Actinomadura harenae]RMI41508.1 hypothetical protein EBO15_23085 [Actinomadura harenae]